MADSRPNIILIETDQQRADTIRAAGCNWMQTPNLDRLAARGALFTNAFACAATCVASRAAFYTGRYPHSNGVWDFTSTDRGYPVGLNWTHRLAAAGYHCCSIGKTHIEAGGHGYHERIAEQGNKCAPWFVDVNGREESLWARELRGAGYDVPLDYHQTDPEYDNKLCAVEWPLPTEWHPDVWIPDRAVQWIDAWEGDNPIFLHLGILGPHDLYDPPQEYIDRYADVEIPLPRVTEDERAGMPACLWASNARFDQADGVTAIRPSRATPDAIRRMRRHYYANVTLVDGALGRIMDALDRKGRLDEAVIIFTSDHGDHLGDHGLFYKGELYDTILKVPLIINDPQLRARGAVREDLVSQLDVAAYLLERAGADTEGLDGISLCPAILEGAPHARTAVIAEEGATGLRPEPAWLASIRTATHRLVVFPGGEEGQMFDLAADPGETINQWDNPACRDLRAQMTARLFEQICTDLHRHRR